MNVIRIGFRNFRGVSLSNHVKAVGPTQQFRFSSHIIGTKPHLEELISNNKVVVFMKGTPEEPKCGFSNAVVQILRMHAVEYDAHNVLEDDKIREGIKEYSEWPTIPQVYLNKEFVGGCDILIQMHQNGDFIEELQKIGIKSALLQQEENRKDK